MRLAPLLAVILGLGFLGSTNALCDQDNPKAAVCQQLDDAKYINSHNLTSLKASVYEKTLRSSSMKLFSPSLKSLDLSEGEIEVIEPGTFRKMTGLAHLTMADNFITHLKESALEGLGKLENFNLRRNKIRELPPALTKLKSLKNLELSGNPIICNCATLRVRDDLLSNSVRISKKVYCTTPSHLKGTSLLELDAEVICMFEEQDNEMQADEPVGSGDVEDELDDPEDITEVPQLAVHRLLTQPDNDPEIINDDLIIPVLGTDSPAGSTTEASANSTTSSVDGDSPSDADDFIFPDDGEDGSLIVQGSGANEPEEDGSGEGSGIWGPINPNDFLGEEKETTTSSPEPTTTTSSPETSTTSSPSWYDVIWSAFSGEDSTTEKSNAEGDKSLTDEEFYTIKSEEVTSQSSITSNEGDIDVGITEETIISKKSGILEGAVPEINSSSETKSGKVLEDFSSTETDGEAGVDNIGEASTHQSKKSMGSYVVLAALLGVLAALVGFAAYKSSLCRKKPNEDPERGSEMKTVHKPLLDTNSANQPKIASNGNTENAPLVAPEDTWAGPQERRQWTDHNPPTLDNGAKFTPSVVESDPVKPPRKSLPPQEDTNGFQEVKTHSPMSTFTPRTQEAQQNSVTPPNSPSSVNDVVNRSPPLSPNTQRVKIKLQENPDSVPKTPILITRTKPGVNLVKTP